MKKYFKNVYYPFILGFFSYLFFVTLLIFPSVVTSLPIKNMEMVLSPLNWILIFVGLGPLFHILASVLILVFTLYKERKKKTKEKLKIILINLVSLFMVDLILFLVLIIYTILNQSVCFVLHSSSNACVLMFAI